MSAITLQDGRTAAASLVPDAFVDFYMPQANGEFVKIYLYLLRLAHSPNTQPTLSSLADVLSCTEKDVLRALRYWEKTGLLSLTFDGKFCAALACALFLKPFTPKIRRYRKMRRLRKMRIPGGLPSGKPVRNLFRQAAAKPPFPTGRRVCRTAACGSSGRITAKFSSFFSWPNSIWDGL